MTWTEKLDNFWIGLLIGISFPLMMFFFYWMFCYSQLSFPRGFMRYLMNGYLLSGVIKLCGLGNLLLFYFGLKTRIDNFSKGIIVSLLAYVALVAYVSYYLEPDLS
ncbi:MAG: hypothetical protein H0W61_18060 [Bacteroidetes bacterium]|nr:hypothetical protein [Bacteroidota bacterium]